MPEPIRICVVDDHPVIAEGIRKLSEETADIAFSGAATNVAELKALLKSTVVDVAILDVRLGQHNGIDLCASLKKSHPEMRIIVLSSFGDSGLVKRAFAAGATGFALKSISLSVLPSAVREVHGGGTFVSSEIVREAMPSFETSDSKRPLSARETEIVRMVSQGLSNKEIARELSISSHTVKLHVARLLKRFDYRSRTQLAGVPATHSTD